MSLTLFALLLPGCPGEADKGIAGGPAATEGAGDASATTTSNGDATTTVTGGTGDATTTGGSDTAGGESDAGGSGGDGDTSPPEDGEFGAPCADNADCDSEFCIETFEGSVCTQTCLGDCPNGWSCKSVLNTLPDVVFVCVPNVNVLCKPCLADKQCNGGKCVPFGAGEDQTFCLSLCETADDCPTSFGCGTVNDPNGETFKGCIPESGNCDCTQSNVGDVRGCQASNEVGTCHGFELCEGATGWSQCSAPQPLYEICDGKDNNCNGKVDEEVGDGDPCTVDNEFGACVGILSCYGQAGAVCNAAEPGPEICDYKDNDCDGQTDAEFKNGDVYQHPQHCGACGVDCAGAVANAVAECNGLDYNPPQCVVDTCVAGYYQVNEFLCAPIPGQICDACANDSDCVVEGAKCIDLNDGTFCTVPCSTNGSCPVGYSCVDVEGSAICSPDSGSCSCDGSNLALQKACELTWKDAFDPDSPLVTCPGVQLCEPEGWTTCLMPDDVCDGVDNDCDGVVDGPWVTGSGKYYTDVHCGVCGNNCASFPFPSASGKCSLEGVIPGCAMVCTEGWFDVNDNQTDGCECQFDNTVDHPDGSDHNCDGVDGEVANAIFVAKSGSDQNSGTLTSPVLTIQKGINQAKAFAKRDVYIATGVYNENVTLTAGVAVYGGYRGDFYDRDITLYETAILALPPKAGTPAAVNAQGLNDANGPATVLDGFSIFGYDNKTPSGSSYAVRIVDSGAQLTVRSNRIFAGSGGNGPPGSVGGSGALGVDGDDGKAAFDLASDNCGAKDNNEGADGGQRSCSGIVVDGGNGGTSICPDFDEDSAPPQCPAQPYVQPGVVAENGKPGNGEGAGVGGEGGHDAYIDRKYGPYNQYNCNTFDNQNCSSCLLPPGQNKHGTAGLAGTDGMHGEPGPGCNDLAGSVVNHEWKPGLGKNGNGGAHGGGGGGGGAAGGVETVGCQNHYAAFSDIGGSGGGGGSGGCAGTGGVAGSGGGGSFGIFVSWGALPTTKPVMLDNVISRGNGGLGGHGGPGGTGGAGGAAGDGGLSGQKINATFCTAGGGKGGSGGHGGHGSGGGGGCGGVSFGIFVAPAVGIGDDGDANWKLNNSFQNPGTPGAGGLGGASLGKPGENGLQGAGGDTNF